MCLKNYSNIFDSGWLDKLVIGGAQIGQEYGCSNANGAIGMDEISEIAKRCSIVGIKAFDTSPQYGQSEALLGSLENKNYFDFITKTQNIYDLQPEESQVSSVVAGFENSLKLLGKIQGILLHQPSMLKMNSVKHILTFLEEMKRHGAIEAIGVSVYERSELEFAFDVFDFDFVQLPLNIFDQRLIRDGTISWLGKNNVSVHCRSVFLQGVLLNETNYLHNKSAALRNHKQLLKKIASEFNCSVKDLCLSFVCSVEHVDNLVCGVDGIQQLNELIASHIIELQPEEFSNLAMENVEILDPRLWS